MKIVTATNKSGVVYISFDGRTNRARPTGLPGNMCQPGSATLAWTVLPIEKYFRVVALAMLPTEKYQRFVALPLLPTEKYQHLVALAVLSIEKSK